MATDHSVAEPRALKKYRDEATVELGPTVENLQELRLLVQPGAKLGVLFDHQYTMQALQVGHLKSNDLRLYQLLLESGRYHLELLTVAYRDTGFDNYDGDDSEQEASFRTHKVYAFGEDDLQYLWNTKERPRPVHSHEMVPVRFVRAAACVASGELLKEEEEERNYTGNESDGCDHDRLYFQGAVVIILKSYTAA
eukprot:TRINITY_DN3214_c0_g1_i2.p1 TRINITY_DN3214_c0_g1~~TRINITY_DN3214_c0_g1_i2.p1  ORF type:complete len:211 (+),score=42.76 TRINITY_DN3214_c0_g1_i2:49-633(+)